MQLHKKKYTVFRLNTWTNYWLYIEYVKLDVVVRQL